MLITAPCYFGLLLSKNIFLVLQTIVTNTPINNFCCFILLNHKIVKSWCTYWYISIYQICAIIFKIYFKSVNYVLSYHNWISSSMIWSHSFFCLICNLISTFHTTISIIFIHFSRTKYSYYIQNDISVLHIIVLVLSYNIFTFHSFFMDYSQIIFRSCTGSKWGTNSSCLCD